MKRFLLALFLLPLAALSQDLSNKGKDFWLAYPGHIDALNSRMALYISSDQATSGVVELNGTTIPFAVTANAATVVQIYPNVYPVYNAQSDGIQAGKGIHVTSLKPIVVYSHVLNAARSGSTIVLPTPTLGREYICLSYTQSNNGQQSAKSQFTVVGVENATTVEITPSVNSIGNTKLANVPFTITLNKGDVYQFQSLTDITGSRVKTISSTAGGCKPVAVFSGSTWTAFDCATGNSGDNLFSQLFPFASWGKNYITAPFATREYDIIRVVVQSAGTVVYRNGIAIPQTQLLGGTYYQFSSSSAEIITSDAPIQVVQYMNSQNCHSSNPSGCNNNCPFPADPEMIILNSVEQTLNKATVLSARNDLTPPNTNITSHYLNIIVKASGVSSLLIDGLAPTATPIPIANSPYVYFQQNVTTSTLQNPTHTIACDSGFIALAYGMGHVESYGYNAGTNVKDLYQFVTLQNQYATVNFPATCRQTPFSFSITLPYQPSSLTWDFNNNAALSPNANVINPAPIADSSYVVDGKTLYVYKLSNSYTFSSTGTFPIKVLANNPTPDGCAGVQEINYDVEVYEKPLAKFSFQTTGCLTDPVYFFDSSFTDGRQITKYQWSATGWADSVKNPVHQFSNWGSITANFFIVTDIGCIADTSMSFELSTVPQPLFQVVGKLCSDSILSFVDGSTIAGGIIQNWHWNLGNGNPFVVNNNATQSQQYITDSTYTVSLHLVSTTGCASDTFSQQLVVKPNPIAAFISPKVCLDDAFANFTDSSYYSDGTAPDFSWHWNFGDPNANSTNPDTSILQNPAHKYISTGSYNVTLAIKSPGGCTSSVTKPITVNGSVPISQFTIPAQSFCSSDSFRIINTSSVDVGNIVTMEIYWDFLNDPTNVSTVSYPLSGGSFSHLYPSFTTPFSKNYTIRMVAYSGQNCFHVSEQVITIKALPQVELLPLAGICLNDAPLALTTGSVLNGLPGSGVYTGPGVSGFLFNPSSAGQGQHTIRYTYTGTNGCTAWKEESIEVFPVPQVNAGPDLFVLEGGSVKIGATSSPAGLSYSWSPAQYLDSPNVLQPKVTPMEDRLYRLVTVSQDGCTNYDEVLVKVLKAPRVPNVFSPNRDGVNDTWIIQYLESYPEATVEVFNRYGQQVFISKGYARPWDGSFKGQPLPAGTYYYIINPRNGRNTLSGFVDLIR